MYIFLLPLAGLAGWEVALQNLYSETVLLLVLTVDFHYSKNYVMGLEPAVVSCLGQGTVVIFYVHA